MSVEPTCRQERQIFELQTRTFPVFEFPHPMQTLERLLFSNFLHPHRSFQWPQLFMRQFFGRQVGPGWSEHTQSELMDCREIETIPHVLNVTLNSKFTLIKMLLFGFSGTHLCLSFIDSIFVLSWIVAENHKALSWIWCGQTRELTGNSSKSRKTHWSRIWHCIKYFSIKTEEVFIWPLVLFLLLWAFFVWIGLEWTTVTEEYAQSGQSGARSYRFYPPISCRKKIETPQFGEISYFLSKPCKKLHNVKPSTFRRNGLNKMQF